MKGKILNTGKKYKVTFRYIPPIGGEHKVFLIGDFNDWNQEPLKMKNVGGIYSIALELPKGKYSYKFIVDDKWIKDENASEFTEDGFGGFNSVIIVDDNLLKLETKIEKFEDFPTPDWVKEGIIYQIFCDRFFNGNPSINPDFREWYYTSENKLSDGAVNERYKFINDWYQIAPLKNDENRDYLFYGGDLEGVKQKLDYLIDLGINIIYFNPLIVGESNHKYDAIDYFKIDPHFGTNGEFKELVQACHEKGIRIIVDFAFNHIGSASEIFQDCLKNGKKSKFYHWFEWKKIPLPNIVDKNFKALDYYQCWWGHPTLPDFNYDKKRAHPLENNIKDINQADVNWDVVNYILKISEFWVIEMDIDGFRLDVPNEVPFWFWELFRKKVKSIKPDVYLVGEIWQNAEQWVNKKNFDAVMNYSFFRDPVLDFFGLRSSDVKTFLNALKLGLLKYPLQSSQVMMNLLDSHDTYRFLEIVHGNIQILELAVLFQMTFIGCPHIFYGDEIGMMGGYDPDNRRTFNWKFSENQELVNLRNFYKKVISIRKQNPAIQKGSFEPIYFQNNVFAYWRKLSNQKLLIIINNNEVKQSISISIDNDIHLKDLLTNHNIKSIHKILNINLNAISGMILKEINL